MSFFIKGKSNHKGVVRTKYSEKQGVKRKAKKQHEVRDEEINSDEDGDNSNEDNLVSEDEKESAQEKKLRLAKVYLEEIAKEERERLEDIEAVTGDVIGKRLRVDHLKQTGKLRVSIADCYKGVDLSNICVFKCKEHHSAITCLCVSSNNDTIFSGSKNGSVVKWSISEKKKVGSIPFAKHVASTSTKVLGHSKEILSLSMSTDDRYLAVGDGSNDIQVWNVQDLKHIGTLKGHRGSVTGLAFRNDTHTLYSGSKDKAVKVWMVDELSYVETLYGHQDGIAAIDALSKERAITCGGSDTSIRVWKIPEESQLLYNGHNGGIDVVKFLNEENFVSGGDDGQICIWSILKKKPLYTVKEAHGYDACNSQPFWITAIAPLINTDLIATGSYDGVIRLWKMTNFRSAIQIHQVQVTGFINDLKFTLDGKFLIAGVGSEHKCGRWTVIKSAKNSVVVIPLLKL